MSVGACGQIGVETLIIEIGDSDTDISSEADTDTDSDTDMDSDTDTDTGTDSDTDTDTDTDTDSDTETGADSDTDSIAGTILHRWSFNGDLLDSIGGSDATIITPGNGSGGNATLQDTSVLLEGGANATSDYVLLGTGLLSSIEGAASIEIWATQVTVQYWSRIFDVGKGEAEYLFMSWTSYENLSSTRVEWKTPTENAKVDSTAHSFTLEIEFHIAMVIVPGVGTDGATLVTWYAAPSSNADLGLPLGSFETVNTFMDFNDTGFWIGRSHYVDGTDDTANASYNEVRIWQGGLTSDELELLHDIGADF